MRVLHVVKTADGAGWAALQAAELKKLGIETHVALPSHIGRAVSQWVSAGAVVHVVETGLPGRSVGSLPYLLKQIRQLVSGVQPDLIHSHFYISTLLLRLALGRRHRTPRLFQVPGPLHMEHWLWRKLDLVTAGPRDFWIASSRYTQGLYREAGVPSERLYLSYYGINTQDVPKKQRCMLRNRLGIPDDFWIVGNSNFMYPPKWYLSQTIGIKAHEDVIDAIGLVTEERSDVIGVLIGGVFRSSRWYEQRLQKRANLIGNGRIVMMGYIAPNEVRQMWPDFDVAVHVPISENCGGVIEPLLAAVPTIAGRVGGLPEVVVDGVTGKLVERRNPKALAQAIVEVLREYPKYRELACVGQKLVLNMFDVRRTGREIAEIYAYVLGERSERPEEFDAAAYLKELAGVVREPNVGWWHKGFPAGADLGGAL